MDKKIIIGIVVALVIILAATYYILYASSSTAPVTPATPPVQSNSGALAIMYTGQDFTGRAIPLYIAKTYSSSDLGLAAGEEIRSFKPRNGWGVTVYVPSGSVMWTSATNGVVADANGESEKKNISDFGAWTGVNRVRVYRESW